MADASFLGIPVEVRLQIYELYLEKHQVVSGRRQPSNGHLRLRHLCRQVHGEAEIILRRYISLPHERIINAFVLHATDEQAAVVEWADVANDSRVSGGSKDELTVPLSNLHLALRRMPLLSRLRVFQCRQGIPVNPQRFLGRISISFEPAMYPKGHAHSLRSYELFLDPETKTLPFEIVKPDSVEVFRGSGELRLPPAMNMPVLKNLMLHGITGNHFDKHSLEESFTGCRLESFVYGQGHRLGFEIRNHHIDSLSTLAGSQLRRLVLIGCSRLSSATLASCLERLVCLEHVTLGLVTVDEMRTNFVRSLPPTVKTFKLQITNAWYAIPLLDAERGLCEAIEEELFLRDPPPTSIYLCFRDLILSEGGREEKWRQMALNRNISLRIGPWQQEDMDPEDGS